MKTKLNLTEIRNALFREQPRTKLTRDYLDDTDEQYSDAKSFTDALLAKFNQKPCEKRISQRYSNAEVLVAAFQAIGSNMRSWATFNQQSENSDRIKMLQNITPAECEDVRRTPPPFQLSGLTGKRDAIALVKWKCLLDNQPEYYTQLLHLAEAHVDTAKSQGIAPLKTAEQMICLALTIGSRPTKTQTNEFGYVLELFPERSWKAPGMGMTLACEFLRNLRWPGFKPDRHIMRLFDDWKVFVANEIHDQVTDRAEQLIALTKASRSKETKSLVECALLGLQLTPAEFPLSHADNLVWALGAYVEKKGRNPEADNGRYLE